VSVFSVLDGTDTDSNNHAIDGGIAFGQLSQIAAAGMLPSDRHADPRRQLRRRRADPKRRLANNRRCRQLRSSLVGPPIRAARAGTFVPSSGT